MSLKSYNRVINRFLLRHIRPNSTVVDVGCGTGTTALLLARERPGCRVEGIDIDEIKIHRANALFAKAKREHLVRCHICSAENLAVRLGRGRYDVVVSTHSFHHYRDPRRALRQIRAILKPGGQLLLSELEPPYGETVDDCPRYSLRKISALVADAHLRVQEARRRKPGVLLVRAERS